MAKRLRENVTCTGAIGLVVILAACSERSGVPVQTPNAVSDATVTNDVSSSLADAFRARGEKRSADCYAIIDELAGTRNWQSRLKAFDVTEIEYASWSDDERAARSQSVLDRANELRALRREMIEDAQRLVAQNGLPQARGRLESARKLGEANTGADLVQMGRLAGLAVYQRSLAALQAIEAAAASSDVKE